MPNSAFQMSATGDIKYNSVVVGPGSPESIGLPLAAQFAVPASTAWPQANTAIFIPFEVFRTWTMMKFSVVNGATVSGNIDVGVYDDDGTRLVSAASSGISTTQTGTSATQTFDFTDYVLSPTTPDCYLAVVMDNTTGTLQAWTPAVPYAAACGCPIMSSAYPLPAIATWQQSTLAYIPECLVSARLVV